MFFIKKIQNTKKKFYKFLLVLSFIISWISIGTDYNGLFLLSSNEEVSLSQIINFMRVALNLFFFPVLCFMFFINMTKYKKNNINLYLVFIIPLFYFLSQTPGLFYTSNSLWNFLFIISSLNILMILNLVVQNFEDDEIYLIIFITFFLLFTVFSIAFINDIHLYSITGKLFYGKINYILGESSIRSSGTSRIALVLLIIYSIFSEKIIKSEVLRIIPIVVLVAAILLYQSRASIGLALLFIIINYIHMKKYSYFDTFKYLIIYFLLPALLFITVISTKVGSHDDMDTRLVKVYEEYDNKEKNLENIYQLQKKIILNKVRFFKYSEQVQTSSGRITDWKNIFNTFDYDSYLLFGYGSQGDRFLINQTASNALIYAFLSSGLIGFMLFIIFTFTVGIEVIKYLFYNKRNEKVSYLSFCILVVILPRSLVESSYALFSVDFILFYTAFILINKNYEFKIK